MALELRIAGPGLDVVRRLEEGEPELVLGRDADCGVCLPDPQRNVSRRHLSVWLEAGELHFHVLSVINGIDMPFGEAPPGARGVLPPGQTLKLAEYSVSASAASSAAPSPRPDPWAVFDREGSGVAPLPASRRASLASGQAAGRRRHVLRGCEGLECVFEVLRRAGWGHGRVDPAPAGPLLHGVVSEGNPSYPARNSRAQALTCSARAQARICFSPLPRRSCCESQ